MKVQWQVTIGIVLATVKHGRDWPTCIQQRRHYRGADMAVCADHNEHRITPKAVPE
jgi:hypothetical protein